MESLDPNPEHHLAPPTCSERPLSVGFEAKVDCIAMQTIFDIEQVIAIWFVSSAGRYLFQI